MISGENLGATSEIGTEKKIRIYFKSKFRNNSLEKVYTWKMRNYSFITRKIFNITNMRMEVAMLIG